MQSELKTKIGGVDKLINALYLAQSDNREKMLSDLIQNVLFILNTPLQQETILKYIKENFHLEPISFEINNVLYSLIESKKILYSSPYYVLAEASKKLIFENSVKTKEESDKRFVLFKKVLAEIDSESLGEEKVKLIWEVFNEYLLECFMLFGRRAIEIFLPFEELSISEDEDIHKNACEKLNNKGLIELFKKLVVEYPQRLSSLELRYLTTLANRAERFYSLGIEKEEYEKIQSLKIKDLVIVLDTNVLYSVLNLRFHNENSVIDELIKLANSKIIDLRLVYIGKTYSELHKAKQHLENIISNEDFRPGHVQSLLQSNKLDSFAKQYYEAKLQNTSTPHPSSKIIYASELLKSRGVNLYNHPFPKLDNQESEYLNGKILDYYDFQRKNGFHKPDPNIFHDVYLREAIIDLKERYSDENELKFVCVTLDNSLVYFDQYMFRKTLKSHSVVNPNFILPSLFLRRIRPFIPIITDDYRKAFLTSLTSGAHEFDQKEQSLLVQKSMTYFKNLGIEDESIIISCIKKDLFLEEMSKLESFEKAESFILSEVGKQIEGLKIEKNNIERESHEVNVKKEEELKSEKQIVSELKQQIFSQEEVKKVNEEVIGELRNEIIYKDETINNLNDRLSALENYQLNLIKQNEKIEKQKIGKEKILNWEVQKNQYLSEKWNEAVPSHRKDTIYLLKSMFIMLLPILIGVIITIFKFTIEQWLSSNFPDFKFYYFYVILGGAQLLELFFRTYIVNKERVKNGWMWVQAFFSRKMYKKLLEDSNFIFINEFIDSNPKPLDE